MAKFVSIHGGLNIGNDKVSVVFENGTYSTEDQDEIKMLRQKMATNLFGIMEVPVEEGKAPAEESDKVEASEESAALKPEEGKAPAKKKSEGKAKK